ncbi:hypothetical protein PACTADRAFT_28837, partial [Pachysolen tannophilus NRRL Y-2460]
KKSSVSVPSEILSNILSDLNLTYDSSLGLLSGPYIISAPPVEKLNDLSKNLNNLKNQLSNTIEDDKEALKIIDEKLQEKDVKSENEIKSVKEDVSIANETRKHNDNNQDQDEEEELVRPRKKSRTSNKIDQELYADAVEIQPGQVKEDLKDMPLSEMKKNDEEQKQEYEEEKDLNGEDRKKEDEEDEDSNDEKYHTPPNDTRIKNPKSEFVTSQTLPSAAASLGLFSEETGGLDQTGEEFLKRKYAVASYPTRDLKDLLPGEIPDVDFSKSKPPNQVQFTTFQSYIEPFFKLYSEEDIKFLKEKYIIPSSFSKNYDPQLHPFLIPKLGPFYGDIWNEEDQSSGLKGGASSVNSIKSMVYPKGSSEKLTDDLLETEDISCGPLVSRLLSALVKDEVDNDDENNNTSTNNNNTNNNNNNNSNNNGTATKKEDGDKNGDDADEDDEYDDDNDGDDNANSQALRKLLSSTTLEQQQGWKATAVKADYAQLDQRLRRELKYIGVYANVQQSLKNNSDEFQEDWIFGKEDDEICAEIRALQRELTMVTRRNNKRKKTLIPLVEEQIAWQEYISILEDLDKQIDQAYLKRIRVPKKSKKRGAGVSHSTNNLTPSALAVQQAQQAHQAAANSGLRSLLDKRSRWINKIGPLFKQNELMRRIPNESIFNKNYLENNEDDDD